MPDDLNYRFALAHAEQLATVGAKRRGKALSVTGAKRSSAPQEPDAGPVRFGLRSGRTILLTDPAGATLPPAERPLSERIADAVGEFDVAAAAPPLGAGTLTVAGIDFAFEGFTPHGGGSLAPWPQSKAARKRERRRRRRG